MKQEHRDNLAKLAAYLEGLPADYEHFNIQSYLATCDDTIDIDIFQETPGILAECGSSACAIGHGPDAGISLLEHQDQSWASYARRVFGTDDGSSKDGRFMFGVDNEGDHLAAAARIREVLARTQVKP